MRQILVGTKCDLEAERQVTAAEANALAKQFKVKYLETSAKENTNVNEAFRKLIQISKGREPRSNTKCMIQ
jgi:GTPase SAR1 family protein